MSYTTALWVIDQARFDCRVNDTQMTNAQALNFFNQRVHEVENIMVSWIRENYFQEDITANLVANTSTYNLPTWTAILHNTVPQLKKLLYISVKWDNLTNTKPYIAKPVDFSWLEKSIEYYEQQQDKTNPLFMLDENTLKIYPTPLSNVTAWLRIIYDRSNLDVQIADIANTTTFTNLTIPRQFRYVVVSWIRIDMFRARGLIEEKNDALQEHELNKRQLKSFLADRFIKPVEWQMPNLFYLMR